MKDIVPDSEGCSDLICVGDVEGYVDGIWDGSRVEGIRVFDDGRKEGKEEVLLGLVDGN